MILIGWPLHSIIKYFCIMTAKAIVHQKNDNSVIVYSPSCCLTLMLLWPSFICGTQEDIFKNTGNYFGDHCLLLYVLKIHRKKVTGIKVLSLRWISVNCVVMMSLQIRFGNNRVEEYWDLSEMWKLNWKVLITALHLDVILFHQRWSFTSS